MDIYSLYDLAQHFTHFVHLQPIVMPSILADTFQQSADMALNVKAALVDDETMSRGERVASIGKLGITTAGLGLCLAGGQFLEAAGLAIAEREEIPKLDSIGAAHRSIAAMDSV